MFKLFNQLIDRCFFVINFIIGLQLPAFIQQYAQRLSGHLHEASYQLGQFEVIADSQYRGNLAALIANYQHHSDSAVVQTGNLIANLVTRVERYQQQIDHLQQEDYLHRLYYFFKELNLDMANATLRDYTLAIPLEMPALVTGLVLAIIMMLVTGMLVKSCASLFTTKPKVI